MDGHGQTARYSTFYPLIYYANSLQMFHITLGAVLRFEEAVEFVAPDPVDLVFVVCSDGDPVVVRWID